MASDRIMEKKRSKFRSCFAVDEFSIIVVSLKGYAITKMSSHTFFPIVSRFPSVSFHNCILPTHSVVFFKSGWFCPDGIFHNHFSWVLIMEKNSSGGKWIIKNMSNNQNISKQWHYICNLAHTRRTAQRISYSKTFDYGQNILWWQKLEKSNFQYFFN